MDLLAIVNICRHVGINQIQLVVNKIFQIIIAIDHRNFVGVCKIFDSLENHVLEIQLARCPQISLGLYFCIIEECFRMLSVKHGRCQ